MKPFILPFNSLNLKPSSHALTGNKRHPIRNVKVRENREDTSFLKDPETPSSLREVSCRRRRPRVKENRQRNYPRFLRRRQPVHRGHPVWFYPRGPFRPNYRTQGQVLLLITYTQPPHPPITPSTKIHGGGGIDNNSLGSI